MKIIVGIGNPGDQYKNTRHNIGYLVVDKLIERLNGKLKLETKFEAYSSTFIVNGEKIVIAKPVTYVNLTGNSLQKIISYYKASADDCLIFSDDVNLPLGKIRLRESGNDGGHNGLKNIIGVLKRNDFKRVRIGIGNDKDIPLSDFVLGHISKSEHNIIDPVLEVSVSIAMDFIHNIPYKDIMTKYNTRQVSIDD